MPIVSAIGAAVAAVSSWTITLGTLGTFAVGNFLIRSVVQVGLSALMVKAMGKPKTAPFSIQSQVRSGGIVPRSFIMGRTGTAGSLVWHSEWGKAGKTPNAYYTRVIALSDLPITGLAKVFVGGVPVTLGPETSEWGHPVAEYHRKDKDHLWIKFYDGTQTVTDPFLVNTVGPQAAVPYEASRRGEGVAYAIVTSRIDEKLFTGFPEAFFVLDGVPLYDPSRDSSVGGSGAHRYNDPTTWGGDGDHYPAVQAYNINRGISYKGQWFYGLQSVAAARLPAANWIAQIEKCRIQVEGADGLEPSFRSGGEILVDTEIGKTQEEILACCSGRMSERGGTFKILVGAPDPAVATITDGDILDTAPQGQDPFQSLSETMNGLIATYPNPDEAFKSRQAPPVFRPDLEAEDGGRRLMGRVSLNMAPYPAQVQRLIDAEIRAARRAVRHSHTLPARFSGLEPNDTIEFVSARNGYASKLFRIDFVNDLENCDIAVDLTEIDPSDHAQWDAQTDYVAPQPGDVPSGGPPPQPIAGWSVTAAASTDAQGAGRFPAIAVGWDGDMDDVIAVEVRARVKATGAMIFSGRFEDVAAAAGLIIAGILPAETYEVQGRYVPGTARQTVWSDWLEVTTLDLRITRDQLQDEIGEAIDAAAYHAAQVGKEIDALLSGFAGGTLKGALDRQRKGLQAGIDGVSAKLSQDYLTAASINKAISSAKKDVVATSEQLGGGVFATSFFGDIWRRWSLGGSKRPGTFYPSGHLYEFTTTNIQNAGLQLQSTQAGWVGASGVDRYRLELEFELVSGATSGAGVLFDWRNTKNQLFRVRIPISDFVSDPIQAGKRYFGSVLVERPVGFTGAFDRHSVYLMANYGGLGARTTKSIRFHKFQAYPATVTDARAAQHAAAISDLQGNASASVVFKVLAGAQSAELGLFAQDGDAGAVSLFRVRATNILLDGSVTSQQIDTVEFRSAGLAVFGGAVMSANFDGTVDAAGNLLTRGTQGFAITQKGDAVFTNLIARDDIQVGAVSAGVTYASSGAQTLPINAEVFRYSLGAFLPGEFWNIACKTTWRGLGTRPEQDNEGDWHIRKYKTGVKLQWRQRNGASWTGWDTIHTFSKTDSSRWRTDDVVVTKLGAFDEVEVRAVVYGYLGPRFPSGRPKGSIIPNVKDVSLYARAIVR